jgi:RNA polymerase sigma factor (sigma-70 family)
MICDQLDLIVKAQAGDVAARNVLIESNLNFIRYVVRFYVGRGHINEYLADGVFGFIKALKYFDVTRIRGHMNAVFWLFIHHEIRNANRALHRSREGAEKFNRRAARLPTLNQPDYGLDVKELWELLDRLTEKERIIVTERLLGVSCADLGRRFNCGRQNAYRIYRAALKKLRMMWDDDFLE